MDEAKMCLESSDHRTQNANTDAVGYITAGVFCWKPKGTYGPGAGQVLVLGLGKNEPIPVMGLTEENLHDVQRCHYYFRPA